MGLVDWFIAAQRPVALRKYRLVSPLIPNNGTRVCRVFGATMEMDLSDLIQRRIYLGCYEREETAIFKREVRPGAVVLDVGANVGYFTALAASLAGSSGRVYAVEPNPTLFAKLSNMVCSTGLRQCTILEAALSEHTGTLTLYEPPPERHNNSSTLVPTEGGREIRVPVRTLDECLEEWGVPQVDFMKIDVEGHETNVFRGAEKALRGGRIKSVLCELNDYWLRQSGTSPEALWQHLLDAGFRLPDGSSTMPEFKGGSSIQNVFLKLHR